MELDVAWPLDQEESKTYYLWQDWEMQLQSWINYLSTLKWGWVYR